MKFREMTDEDVKGMREQITVINTLAEMLIKVHSKLTGITYTYTEKKEAFGVMCPVYNINCSNGDVYPLEIAELYVDILSTRHNYLTDPEWPEGQECSESNWDEKTRDPKYFQIKMGIILKNMLHSIDIISEGGKKDPDEFMKRVSKKFPHHKLKMELDKNGKLIELQGFLISELQRIKEEKE